MTERIGCVVIVTGGRDYADERWVWRKLDTFHRRWPIALLRHGAASGTDTFAKRWANSRGVATDPCKAAWRVHGKAAGPIRNSYMLEKQPRPTFCIAFPGGTGTADMVRKADAASGVRVIRVRPRRFLGFPVYA